MSKIVYKKPHIKITYFTDPVCSTCWIIDTYIDKLLQEYQDIITLEVKMGGLLRSWDDLEFQDKSIPKEEYICRLWDDESQKNGICLDPKVWRSKPVSSSYPASIAYYAAKYQGRKKAFDFLYSLREMLFLQGKDISEESTILAAALEHNLNIDEFNEALENGKAEALFYADMMLRDELGVVEFPTLIFTNLDGEAEMGKWYTEENNFEKLYENWEEIIQRLTHGKALKKIQNLNARDVLKSRTRLSLKQICVLTGKKEELIEKELLKLHFEGVVVEEHLNNVKYWRYNDTTFRIKKNRLSDKEISILGGGIGGVYTAICTQIAGNKAKVYERRTDYTKHGIGFIVLKNGINALDAIGLKNNLYKRGNTINKFKAIEPTGDLIVEKYLNDCIAISRQDFMEMLLNEVDQEVIQFNQEVSTFEQNGQPSKLVANLESGRKLKADIFIASDGIHSKIRQNLFPDQLPVAVSEREIVGKVHCPNLEFKIDQFIKIVDTKQGIYMGVLPLGNDDYIWFVQFNNELTPIEDSSVASLQVHAKQFTENYPSDFKRIIEATDFSDVFLWVSKRMDILPRFDNKNVVLVGDAAHPLLPFTSQGANSAVEDGAALISILTNQCPTETLEMAFEEYYENRKISIEHYLKEGDMLLRDFENLSANKGFNLPLSVH